MLFTIASPDARAPYRQRSADLSIRFGSKLTGGSETLATPRLTRLPAGRQRRIGSEPSGSATARDERPFAARSPTETRRTPSRRRACTPAARARSGENTRRSGIDSARTPPSRKRESAVRARSTRPASGSAGTSPAGRPRRPSPSRRPDASARRRESLPGRRACADRR